MLLAGWARFVLWRGREGGRETDRGRWGQICRQRQRDTRRQRSREGRDVIWTESGRDFLPSPHSPSRNLAFPADLDGKRSFGGLAHLAHTCATFSPSPGLPRASSYPVTQPQGARGQKGHPVPSQISTFSRRVRRTCAGPGQPTRQPVPASMVPRSEDAGGGKQACGLQSQI